LHARRPRRLMPLAVVATHPMAAGSPAGILREVRGLRIRPQTARAACQWPLARRHRACPDGPSPVGCRGPGPRWELEWATLGRPATSPLATTGPGAPSSARSSPRAATAVPEGSLRARAPATGSLSGQPEAPQASDIRPGRGPGRWDRQQGHGQPPPSSQLERHVPARHAARTGRRRHLPHRALPAVASTQ
jgi:hypothetical protein